LARVLIVDDKADIRSLVTTRLRLEPAFEVVGEATNGAEAIARAGELRPHVMVLDLQMPVMSGEEVIPILRSLAPNLQILVYSAYAGTQQILRGTERPDGEVRKDSGLPALVKELHRLLGEPPADVVDVDLGEMEVGCAAVASRAWMRLNPSVREMAVEEGTAPDFLALVGVFLALGEPLQAAVRMGRSRFRPALSTRLAAGCAARRALGAIRDPEAEALEPLRGRLLASLPEASVSAPTSPPR
jgi:CheY-like chemotaxis protein